MPIPISDINYLSPQKKHNTSYLLPLILVTSLFFLWGLAYGLLDVLNKHFQETLNITKHRSTLLQAAYFGAYFLMAIPSGMFITKVGYKKGIITGLMLYAAGALLFFPSASMGSFESFLVSLFILASGLTLLETAANPYVTILGKPDNAAFRLNLSQSFNGIGSFIGPLIGGWLFFGSSGQTSDNKSVQVVYLVIGVTVLVIAALFYIVRLPEVQISREAPDTVKVIDLFYFPRLKWAVVALFFYVAAQVGMAALFINYCTEINMGITNEKASYLLSASLLLFTLGRFAGTALMKVILPPKLLCIYALISMGLCGIVTFAPGMFSIYCLMAVFFFASIMFPTIFALGIRGLGNHTKKGASLLIMAIVGGAVAPVVMGSFASTILAYIIPMFCFGVVFVFSFSNIKKSDISTD